MSTHNSHWKEAILAWNIIDIRHQPGVENLVADGLSRMWTERKRTPTDGSDWSVLADWETSTGIQQDLFGIDAESSPISDDIRDPLQTEFADDLFFSPIIDHLLGLSGGMSISERRCATHRASGFMIEDGKLWRIPDKASRWVAQTRCVPTAKGFTVAMQIHAQNGHLGLESTKLKIADE
ncbi:hypothetical protein DFH07DRAFT_736816 [Mycena maculata]|uniref:Uncharacterized protein n=1 Tax=Mycena maculata TaxID=230809 RepID=A0AAD7JLP2_9AGAR|nr:hypothetical protein DFH07DRAFT_736816 [Mycena maculata]